MIWSYSEEAKTEYDDDPVSYSHDETMGKHGLK